MSFSVLVLLEESEDEMNYEDISYEILQSFDTLEEAKSFYEYLKENHGKEED